MMKKIWGRKLLVLGILVALSSPTLFAYSKATSQEEYPLPPPDRDQISFFHAPMLFLQT
jgi:hypothetical protein